MKVTDKATGASHEQEVTLDRDEGPRPDTTLAKLAALEPVYAGGTTTADSGWRSNRRPAGPPARPRPSPRSSVR